MICGAPFMSRVGVASSSLWNVIAPARTAHSFRRHQSSQAVAGCSSTFPVEGPVRATHHQKLAVQCRAMRSRFRVGVVLVTLTVHLFAPLAAYASATPGPRFDDLCSANRNTTALPNSTPALPQPYAPKHASSHCAFCSGSASATVLPSTLSLPAPLAHAEVSLRPATSALITATAVLLPPSRGPPRAS
jgi:Protein of unknown function (DUF2946)